MKLFVCYVNVVGTSYCPYYTDSTCLICFQVQEGIEIGAYESIPGDQKINLFEILGDQFPPEVVNNLQGQIDQVGKH